MTKVFEPTTDVLETLERLVATALWIGAYPVHHTYQVESMVAFQDKVVEAMKATAEELIELFPEDARTENPFTEDLVKIAGGRIGTAIALMNEHLRGGWRVGFQVAAELNVTLQIVAEMLGSEKGSLLLQAEHDASCRHYGKNWAIQQKNLIERGHKNAEQRNQEIGSPEEIAGTVHIMTMAWEWDITMAGMPTIEAHGTAYEREVWKRIMGIRW